MTGWLQSKTEQLGLSLIQGLEPERAHRAALWALRAGLAAQPGLLTSDRLRTSVAGLPLTNPVGLAAGFDKNAEALLGLSRAGFGFVEVGAVTPRPQPGNPRPRLFRLPADDAVINRFGFNNDGMVAVGPRLAQRPRDMVLGLNLGANKDSADRARDYVETLNHCAAHLDFATVNVSSPNTEKLRDLQGKDALAALLDGVMAARDSLAKPIPVFLKIAPDLDTSALKDVAEVAALTRVDGIIATNTTLDRSDLKSPAANQAGGLSGAPLFRRSTHVLAALSALTGGTIPIIGVGGVSNVDQAWVKITAGASAVQLYTALAYQGLGLVQTLVEGLDARLQREGFSSVAEAVGTQRDAWL